MRLALFVTIGLLAAADLFAQTNLKLVKVFLAGENEHKPTTEFSSDARRINVYWKGQGLEVGDKLRAVWVAEDVGEASPKETKINEKMIMATKRDEEGSFFLARPTKQSWPVGKYRLDFFINDKLAQVVKFTVVKGVGIDVYRNGN
jgi:hypothetical protein